MSFDEIEAIRFLGSKVIDLDDTGRLIFKLIIDLVALYIITIKIFYPVYRDRSYVFAYSLINISVFLLCVLLSGVKLKMGFAFGMFAVFSIIRYRTEQIPIKQMTYLFVIIVISVINALANKKVSHAELLITNALLVAAVFYLEKFWYFSNGGVRRVKYERIELVKPGKNKELIEDLRERTGLDVNRVDVVNVNFLNDTAELKVYFHPSRPREEHNEME